MNIGLILALLLFNVINKDMYFISGLPSNYDIFMTTNISLCKTINYNTPTMWKICADGHHLPSGPYGGEPRIILGCQCLFACHLRLKC